MKAIELWYLIWITNKKDSSCHCLPITMFVLLMADSSFSHSHREEQCLFGARSSMDGEWTRCWLFAEYIHQKSAHEHLQPCLWILSICHSLCCLPKWNLVATFKRLRAAIFGAFYLPQFSFLAPYANCRIIKRHFASNDGTSRIDAQVMRGLGFEFLLCKFLVKLLPHLQTTDEYI